MNILISILMVLGTASNAVPKEQALQPADLQFVELNQGPEIALSLKSTLISGNTVKIGYEIPYPGYIEFLLLDNTGKKLWYNAYVKEKGEHFLAFKREKLEVGSSYTFIFRYKGNEFPGVFVNNE